MNNQIKVNIFISERIMRTILKTTNLTSFKFSLKFKFLVIKIATRYSTYRVFEKHNNLSPIPPKDKKCNKWS